MFINFKNFLIKKKLLFLKKERERIIKNNEKLKLYDLDNKFASATDKNNTNISLNKRFNQLTKIDMFNSNQDVIVILNYL